MSDNLIQFLTKSKISLVPPYKDYIVPDEKFNHEDFLIANNVGKLQNALILQWLSEIYANPY